MTESTTPDTTPPAPTAPAPRAKAQTADSDVYAVYDTVFKRFVGGTHTDKSKADAAAKDLTKSGKVRKAQVRKV